VDRQETRSPCRIFASWLPPQVVGWLRGMVTKIRLVPTWPVTVTAGVVVGVEVAGWLAVGLAGNGVVSVAGGVDAVSGVDGVVVNGFWMRPRWQICKVWWESWSENSCWSAVLFGRSHVVRTWKGIVIVKSGLAWLASFWVGHFSGFSRTYVCSSTTLRLRLLFKNNNFVMIKQRS